MLTLLFERIGVFFVVEFILKFGKMCQNVGEEEL